jgi:hypothetical protein
MKSILHQKKYVILAIFSAYMRVSYFDILSYFKYSYEYLSYQRTPIYMCIQKEQKKTHNPTCFAFQFGVTIEKAYLLIKPCYRCC